MAGNSNGSSRSLFSSGILSINNDVVMKLALSGNFVRNWYSFCSLCRVLLTTALYLSHIKPNITSKQHTPNNAPL
jgi:hypothetical protein